MTLFYIRKKDIVISVIKSEQNESGVEFLDNAHKLKIYSIQQCVNFPKRYTFFVSTEIANTANAILTDVKCGNSIYPTNEHEVQKRRDYFLEAYASAQALISQINSASEIFSIPGKVMIQWMELINNQLKYTKGIMDADKKRYKKLLAK